VDAIGDRRLAADAITVAVHPADATADATVLVTTGCRDVTLAVSWDDSVADWIAFEWPDGLSTPCAAELTRVDRDFFDALSTAETYDANGDSLVLHGIEDIRLRRSR
jgi:hypothetical protein